MISPSLVPSHLSWTRSNGSAYSTPTPSFSCDLIWRIVRLETVLWPSLYYESEKSLPMKCLESPLCTQCSWISLGSFVSKQWQPLWCPLKDDTPIVRNAENLGEETLYPPGHFGTKRRTGIAFISRIYRNIPAGILRAIQFSPSHRKFASQKSAQI